MAPSKTLEVSATREGAMLEIILPSTMVSLLVAFEPCLTAPSYRTFSLLVAGWIHCVGRRTVTAVAVASGGVDNSTCSARGSAPAPPPVAARRRVYVVTGDMRTTGTPRWHHPGRR